MEKIIETTDLSHIYSPNTPFQRLALDKVNFFAYEGEYLGIIGHTGSGKSTLMQHLNGLLKPSSGGVRFRGEDIWSSPEQTRNTRFQVGLVFQYPEYQLFEETVFLDIAFGPKNMGLSPAEVEERVHQASAFVGVAPALLEKSPFELSGGQKRRVAIAGVIAMEPKVLILDEPTAGLDPRGSKEILENIQEYQKAHNATIILVSHSMEDVANIAQRLVVMEKGSVSLEGAPAQVFSQGETLENMGLGIPQMSRVFHRLHSMGIPVDTGIFTVEQARDAIISQLGGQKPWH